MTPLKVYPEKTTARKPCGLSLRVVCSQCLITMGILIEQGPQSSVSTSPFGLGG